MNVRELLVALIGITLPLSLNGMVSYKHLITPDNKHILLMGDMHNWCSPGLTKYFSSRILYMRQTFLKRPIPFIVEFENSSDTGVCDFVSETIKILFDFQKAQEKSTFEPFKFEFCDLRSKISGELEAIMSALSDALTREIPSSYVEAHYGLGTVDSEASVEAHLQAWKELHPTIKLESLSRSVSIQQYLEYLESNQAKIQKFVQNCSDQKLTETIAKSLETYKDAKKKCEELLKGQPPTRSFAYTIATLFDTCSTIEERMSLYDEINRLFCNSTDFLSADIFFLGKVLEKVATDPVVCMYSGYWHTRAVSCFLVEGLGCKVVSEEDSIKVLHPLVTVVDREAQEALLETSVIDTFLAPVSSKPGTCWSCDVKKEDLSKCGKCKRAAYCGKNCQNADWKTHKTVCVAAKLPQTVLEKTS